MKKNTTYRLVLLALFAALVLLLGFTPLGLIPLGFINVTILCVPVIVGALSMGQKEGVVLGVCFGMVSAVSALTKPTSLVAPLLSANLFLTMVMCFLPRIAVPVVACQVYRLVSRSKKRSVKALPFAAAAGSLTNTILYLGLMLLFYILVGLDAAPVLSLVAGIGLIAGGCEAVAAALLVTPITLALWKIQRA